MHDQGLYLKLTEGLADQEVIFYLDLEYRVIYENFYLSSKGFLFFLFVFLRIIRMFGSGPSDKLFLVDFLEAVGNLRFRGTSVLLRLPVSIIKLAQDEMYESLTQERTSVTTRYTNFEDE